MPLFKPEPLPYAMDALEPYIDATTMDLHYNKHYQAYIKNFNNLLEKNDTLAAQSVQELLKNLSTLSESNRLVVRNHGGGSFNHAMFWTLMKPNGGGNPKDLVLKAIVQEWGSFDLFKDIFNATAKTVFGSGWAWLCINADKKLIIVATYNQDNPLSQGLVPIMGLDVWEHAYYLRYQNRRPDYINAWWHVINWEQVEENYKKAL